MASSSEKISRILLRAGRTLCIGLAGGSGTGKTTLARRLIEHLGPENAVIVPCDAYYRDRPELARAERDALNFDHPDALELDGLARDLASLRAGVAVFRPVYDFETHRRAEAAVPVRPRPVVVVEGVLLLVRAEVRAALDLSVFLEAPEAVRLARRIGRDARERARSPEDVRRQFGATVAPMHSAFVEPSRVHADLVLDTGGAVDPLDSLLARIAERASG